MVGYRYGRCSPRSKGRPDPPTVRGGIRRPTMISRSSSPASDQRRPCTQVTFLREHTAHRLKRNTAGRPTLTPRRIPSSPHFSAVVGDGVLRARVWYGSRKGDRGRSALRLYGATMSPRRGGNLLRQRNLRGGGSRQWQERDDEWAGSVTVVCAR
jgi:hypothetical protein